MRTFRLVTALVVSFAASSCTTGLDRFERLQRDAHPELTKLYPPGQPYWTTEYQGSVDRWNLDEDPPSRFASFLRERVSQSHESAVGCWIAEVPRWPKTPKCRNWSRYTPSLHDPIGLWIDYVFVDSEERILAAYRRFID